MTVSGIDAQTPPHERTIVGVVLIAFVLLALAFSTGAIFEPPDEIEHYRYTRHVATEWTLPDPRAQFRGQFHHAPLYYALIAPFAALLPDSDFEQIDGRLNPYYPFEIDVPGSDNKNLYLHTRAEEFPAAFLSSEGSETARAVHLLRLTSIALGAITVLVSYRIIRLLFESPAKRIIALGVVTFHPQFVYLSGSLNNDNLLFLLSAITLLIVLYAARHGMTWRLAAALGITLGAVLLTKVSAAFLVFPVGAAILLHRRWWRYIPVTAVLVVAIAGWWYVRNWALYGDPTLVSVLLQTWQAEVIRPGEIALDVALQRIPYSYQTFWARFGQGAVPVHPAIYAFFDALIVIAGIGWVARLGVRRVPFTRESLVMAGIVLIGLLREYGMVG
jgi:4-amino-4-deoxy-L-arabinose transferase-like glycosyltransferase